MVVDFRIDVDNRAVLGNIKTLQIKLKQKPIRELQRLGLQMRDSAIKKAYENAKYSKTGNLAKSIKVSSNTAKGTVTITADRRTAPYANIVEGGARPHRIPNNPIWRGRIHPGMKGKFFMTRTANEFRGKALVSVTKGVDLAIRESGFKRR